ncbi:MAG: hypothetical protein HY343_09515 [Lentisphaerae bacterium]|nr:hypothetical protein [Lentisphaerota bacterium]
MTALLEKAINRVSDMPARQQNAIARLLLAELDAEGQWDASFSASQHELAQLAGQALAERRRGKTRKMDLAHDF